MWKDGLAIALLGPHHIGLLDTNGSNHFVRSTPCNARPLETCVCGELHLGTCRHIPL